MQEHTSPFPRNNIRFRRFATTNQTRYLKSEGGVIFGIIFERDFFSGMEGQLALHFLIV